MNIQVIKEVDHWGSTQTGGEYADCTLNITVDKELPIEQQRLLVIHAIIENYFRSIPHDKVDEICELIADGLEQLNKEG